MKKIIVAFFAVSCIFTVGYGQDSSSRFSVGILAGPYFNTGSRDYIYPIGYYYRGTDRTRNFSYGIELTWFKFVTNKTKHGISAKFLYSVGKGKHTYKGPSEYSSWTSVTTAEETGTSSQRNYTGSIGYKLHQNLINKLYLIVGADIIYTAHEKRFQNSNTIRTNVNTGEFESSSSGHSVSPQGYSTGLGLNAGIEYELLKGFTIGGQVTSGLFYSHFFGKGHSVYRYKYAGSPDSFSENTFSLNTHGYNISPLNYTLSARYYF